MNLYSSNRPQGVSDLRRAAHEFLRRTAAYAWECEPLDGLRWDIAVPPEIEALPERKRFRTHARQEAQRLASARLYGVCPQLTRRAVTLGAAIHDNRHGDAVALTGRTNTIETLAIQAPSETGFLRWQDPGGIGPNSKGVPIIACHWGPTKGDGRWMVWWSETSALAKVYAADAAADGLPAMEQHQLSIGILAIFGPVFYDSQDLLRPHDPSAPEPEPGEDDEPPDVGFIYSTLATWWLLSSPDNEVQLSQQPLTAAEKEADRAAGLDTGPITLASAVEVP